MLKQLASNINSFTLRSNKDHSPLNIKLKNKQKFSNKNKDFNKDSKNHHSLMNKDFNIKCLNINYYNILKNPSSKDKLAKNFIEKALFNKKISKCKKYNLLLQKKNHSCNIKNYSKTISISPNKSKNNKNNKSNCHLNTCKDMNNESFLIPNHQLNNLSYIKLNNNGHTIVNERNKSYKKKDELKKANSCKSFSVKKKLVKLKKIISKVNGNMSIDYKEELNNLKLTILKLQDTISILENKIKINQNINKNYIKEKDKDIQKIEKLKYINKNCYQNNERSIDNYYKLIQNFQNQINNVKQNTMEINLMVGKEQNHLEILKTNIKKINIVNFKVKKENRYILLAIDFYKRHTSTVKDKIKIMNNEHNNAIEKLNDNIY